jgi:hypothetical protein
MRTNYTPGPWHVEQLGEAFIIESPNGIPGAPYAHLARVHIMGNKAGIANSKIIAAAPELLEVIKTVLAETQAAEGFNMEKAFQLLDWLKDHGNDLMRNAIAKATGEPVTQ